jgi:hypothetical protein
MHVDFTSLVVIRTYFDACSACQRPFVTSISTASQGHHADGHPGNPREVWLDHRPRAGSTGLNEALCAIEFRTLASPTLATRLLPLLLPSEQMWATELVRIAALPVPLDATARLQG